MTEICWKEVNIKREGREIRREWWGRRVASVSKEGSLYGRSVAKKIMFGLEGNEIEP